MARGSGGRTVTLANGDTDALIRAVIDELSADEAYNPSHVYARILRKAIQKGLELDELHLGDVLMHCETQGTALTEKRAIYTRIRDGKSMIRQFITLFPHDATTVNANSDTGTQKHKFALYPLENWEPPPNAMHGREE